ncbi:hypothetical protein GCM10010293_29250 [Streptomyces griseoflavus]|nr:hypothetical protein GCM10010293_29250 [Streptomyces griseoflavus]
MFPVTAYREHPLRRHAQEGHDATTTLITGGNRGLGHEIARRLVQAGQRVWIGARDAGNGR